MRAVPGGMGRACAYGALTGRGFSTAPALSRLFIVLRGSGGFIFPPLRSELSVHLALPVLKEGGGRITAYTLLSEAVHCPIPGPVGNVPVYQVPPGGGVMIVKAEPESSDLVSPK